MCYNVQGACIDTVLSGIMSLGYISFSDEIAFMHAFVHTKTLSHIFLVATLDFYRALQAVC